MESISIEELPELSRNELSASDLLLVSHNTGIGTENGLQVYVSKKLSVEDFSYMVRGNIKELVPDNATLSTNAQNLLYVNKVRLANVTGLGDLATMHESDLKLSSMSHINIWTGTLAEYDRLEIKNSNTLYFIMEF